MTTTYLELLDAGVCTSSCLLAPPKTRCDCRCNGFFHSLLCDYLARRESGWVEFPGFHDIDIIKRGRRQLMVDHTEGVQLWGNLA